MDFQEATKDQKLFKRFDSYKYRGYTFHVGENATYIQKDGHYISDAVSPRRAMEIIDEWQDAP